MSITPNGDGRFFASATLGFLAWNISDGVIYFHGDGVKRLEHPVLFWVEAALLAAAAFAFLHAAVFAKHKSVEKPA